MWGDLQKYFCSFGLLFSGQILSLCVSCRASEQNLTEAQPGSILVNPEMVCGNYCVAEVDLPIYPLQDTPSRVYTPLMRLSVCMFVCVL